MYEEPQGAGRALLVVLLACTLLGVAMAVPPWRDAVQQVDDAWYEWVQSAGSQPLIAVAHGLAFVGSAIVMLPLRLGVAMWLAVSRQWDRLGVWIGANALAEVTTTVGKLAYARPRPPMPLELTPTWAFPSGHAMAAAVTSLTLVLVFTTSGSRRVWALVGAIGYSVAMAWSRTYLQVHWLSDVVGGLLVGTAAALLAVVVLAALLGERPKAP